MMVIQCKSMKQILFYIQIIIFLVACSKKEDLQIQATLENSGNNRSELEKVLSYYEKENPNKLKLKAARFLIANMDKHFFIQSKQIDFYKTEIRKKKKPISKDTLSTIWKHSERFRKFNKETIEDSQFISSSFLISYIDQCIEGWLNSPWKADVSFDNFCHYILPYRVYDEQLSYKWRDSLRKKYMPIIAHTNNVKEAYVKILKAVNNKFRESKVPCPYTPDILTLDYMLMGPCKDQCILNVAILRALSIPATYDYVTHWTNYSQTGHSWVALVLGEKTYTWEKTDTTIQLAGKISSSIMKAEKMPNKNYPYSIDTLKKVSKVYRMYYAANMLNDVSDTYQINGQCEIKVSSDAEIAYLCTFRTGKDWEPIAATYIKRGECIFKNIGYESIYIIMKKENNKFLPITYPFRLKNNNEIEWYNANKHVKQDIILTRKYPLFGHWISQWNKMIGGKIEASNYPDFKNAITLDSITNLPTYKNILQCNINQKFRYVRYVCPPNCRTPLAELEFYEKETGNILHGKPIGSEELAEKSIKQTFDNNLMSVCSTKKKYWVGLDLNKKYSIGNIILYPKNDGNFIDIGDHYELFYYDNGWISLGKKTASDIFLKYNNAPRNALFLLKNYSKGKEERIFIYKNNKQIWG